MQALLSTQQHHLVNRQSMKRYLMCVLVETHVGKVGSCSSSSPSV